MASRKKRPVPSKPARGGSRPGARTVRSAGSARGLQTTVGAVAEVIGSLEYPGAIIGGIAVIAWGHGRATSDVDCAIAAPISAAEEVLDAFEAAGFAPRYDGALAFARQNLLLPLTHTVTGVSVDASLAQLEFEHTALAHAVTLPFLDARIPVPPVTDLLIYKMVAGRPQDVADVRRLLALGHRVDKPRVSKTLESFDEILDTDQAGEWRRLLASLK